MIFPWIWENTVSGDESWKSPVRQKGPCTAKASKQFFRGSSYVVEHDLPEMWSSDSERLGTAFFRYGIRTPSFSSDVRVRFTADSKSEFFLNGVYKGRTTHCEDAGSKLRKIEVEKTLCPSIYREEGRRLLWGSAQERYTVPPGITFQLQDHD